MSIHYSFPSIEQYRTVVKYVRDRCAHAGVELPKLSFHGTVKLHGTNASVVVGPDYYAQSRSTVLSLEADNAGFAAFALQPQIKEALTRFANEARDAYFRDRDYVEPFPATTVVYGEWCGGNIQSDVALNKLPKMFVIFAVRLVGQLPADEDLERSIWLMPWDVEAAFDKVAPDGAMMTNVGSPAAVMAELPIYCIEKFPTYKVVIDFKDPTSVQNQLVELTKAVEAECPVSAAFGSKGVGEGIVWTCVGGDAVQIRLSDLVFKVKGEKHSDTKVTKLASVDVERLASIKALAEAVTTDHRLEKGLAALAESGVTDLYDVKNLGAFLKWVGNDVLKEETDTIIENGFEPREVTKAVNELAKAWFFARSST